MGKTKTFIALAALFLSVSACTDISKSDKNDGKQQIDATETTANGGQSVDNTDLPTAKDFTLNDINGKKVSLQEVVSANKITIIDFWASWCQPCMREMPNLVRLYENHEKDGLGIIGVSLDNDASAWKNAVEATRMQWIQVSDLKGWDCSAARLYDVEAIPHTVILDNAGHILAEDLRGQELSDFIDSHIK